MKILVCGGREFGNDPKERAALNAALDRTHARRPVSALIHGAARGADTAAAEWAQAKGIELIAFPADWKTHGRSAGHLRNGRMLIDGRPDGIIAFPGGRGTSDMVRKARKARVRVWFPLGDDWLTK